MCNNSTFTVSQETEILVPKKSKSYPVTLEDWNFLKEKIEKNTIKQNWFSNVSYILIGGALSFLGTSLTMASELPNTTKFISWGICVVCFIIGIALFFLSKTLQKSQQESVEDIIKHMNLIENRFNKNNE